jgi:hypothetical protein
LLIAPRADQRVAIIHDRTTGYDGVILDAFNFMMNDLALPKYRQLFTTITPMRWQDCIRLQPADMIAFDTFKLLDGTINSSGKMRRSLQALVGAGVTVAARYYGESSLKELAAIEERRLDAK